MEKHITTSEQRIIKEVMTGASNKEIGSRLLIQEKTVKWYLTIIFKKLGVKKRSELMAKIYQQKISELSPLPEGKIEQSC